MLMASREPAHAGDGRVSRQARASGREWLRRPDAAERGQEPAREVEKSRSREVEKSTRAGVECEAAKCAA